MLGVPYVPRTRDAESPFQQRAFRRGGVEGGSKMGNFVAVDLLSMLGSLYHWAIERALSEAVGKAGVHGGGAGVKEM